MKTETHTKGKRAKARPDRDEDRVVKGPPIAPTALAKHVTQKPDGTKQYPPKDAMPPAAGNRGRGKIVETLSPEDLAKEINDLIDELRSAKDVDEKKRIRRALRLRGHRGGLATVPAEDKTEPEAPAKKRK